MPALEPGHPLQPRRSRRLPRAGGREAGAGTITTEQLDILRHTIGLNYIPRHDRNHYACKENDADMLALVDLDLMEKIGGIPGGLSGFRATFKGLELLREEILHNRIIALERENEELKAILREEGIIE